MRRASIVLCLLLVIGCSENSSTRKTDLLATRTVRTLELPSSALFANIVDTDWLGDTAVLILDDEGKRLHSVNWSTQTPVLLAAHGSGPGELQGATSVLSLGTKGFAVVDPGARQFSLWTTSGEVRRTRPISSSWGSWIVGSTIVLKSQEPRTAMLTFRSIDTQMERADSIVARIDVLAAADLPCLYCPTAVSNSGKIAAATRDSAYLIRRYRADGTEQTPIRRDDMPPVLLSKAELDSVRLEWDGAIEGYISRHESVTPDAMDRIRRARDAATVKKRFLPDGLRFDDEDRLWVQRHVPEPEPGTIDIYDVNGNALGTAHLEIGERLLRVREGRLLALLEREDGSARIRELAIVDGSLSNR